MSKEVSGEQQNILGVEKEISVFMVAWASTNPMVEAHADRIKRSL